MASEAVKAYQLDLRKPVFSHEAFVINVAIQIQDYFENGGCIDLHYKQLGKLTVEQLVKIENKLISFENLDGDVILEFYNILNNF